VKDPRFSKFVVLINGAVPLALLAWDGYYHHLGANPTLFAIHTTGMLTLIFLFLTLCVTPLRKMTGWNWLSHFRRMLGLYAFFYGCVHLLTYLVFDQSLNLLNVVKDTFARRFIFFGMFGLLLMVPLAITSTNAMIKRLGAKKWKRLHQLVYVSAMAGVVHYYLLVKADTRLPLTFVAVLGALFLYRIFANRFSILRAKPRAAAAS
jgi:sulfoxide reductase heme-binding subunit YedZ